MARSQTEYKKSDFDNTAMGARYRRSARLSANPLLKQLVEGNLETLPSDINVNISDENGNSALMWAIDNLDVDRIRKLIETLKTRLREIVENQTGVNAILDDNSESLVNLNTALAALNNLVITQQGKVDALEIPDIGPLLQGIGNKGKVSPF